MPVAARALVLCIAACAAVAGVHASAPTPASRESCLNPRSRTLQLYDGLLHTAKPNLTSSGFAKAHIIDRDIWTDEKTRRAVSPQKLRSVVTPLARSGDLVVLDIEHFPLTGSDETVARSVGQLVATANAARAAAGGTPVGYYGLVPLSEYWRPINGLAHGGFREWREDNQRLMPLAAAVDVNLPSLYTHYEDREGWVKQAEAVVCEARLMSDKPVIAFIWPEFHPGSPLAGRPVPPDYWRLQLETLSRIADGVVIWGGYDLARGRHRTWDERAPWWQETRRFQSRHRSDRSLRPVS